MIETQRTNASHTPHETHGRIASQREVETH